MKSIFYTTIFSLFGFVFSRNITCESFYSIQLCNSNTCPQDYHMCTSYDSNIIAHNLKMNAFEKVKIPYVTYISINGETCNNDPTTNRLVIEPQKRHYSGNCNYNNRFINYGEGILVDKCFFCICDTKRSYCINTCDYNSIYTNRINDYTSNPKNSLQVDQQTQIKCNNHNYNHIACCRNNECLMPYCESCENYGVLERCNTCAEGYYLMENKMSKCYSQREITSICDGFYNVNNITGVFSCKQCINGVIVNDQYESQCVCDDGYFGNDCSRNYNKYYCNNNGIFNIETSNCSCKENYNGNDCSTYNLIDCINGIYNSRLDKCVCNNGFYGTTCEKAVECVHGTILESVCLCNDGFSGDACNIFKQEDNNEKNTKTLQLREYYERPCKYGILNNETMTCDCLLGYNGRDCSEYKCKNGVYEPTSDTCMCNSNYYGTLCEYNCEESCNFNGNTCLTNNTCTCYDGWSGEFCNTIKILPNTNITISKSIVVNINTEVETLDSHSIDIIECYSLQCLPFKIYNNKTMYNQRMLNYDETTNKNIVIELRNMYINTDTHGIYVYPDNNENESYYGGQTTINITTLPLYTNYFFYVENIEAHVIRESNTYTTNSDDISMDNSELNERIQNNTNNNNTESSSSDNGNVTSSESSNDIDMFGIQKIYIYSGGVAIIVLIGLTIFISSSRIRNNRKRQRDKKIIRESLSTTSMYYNQIHANKQPSNNTVVHM